jgi:histidine ammonia-lyase
VNAATDNPLVFTKGDGVSDESELLSAGNFHGQPLSIALDYLGLSVASLGAISERRTDQMVNPRSSRLPAFLTPDPGLRSGFMMPHVTAAALVSENKVHAHPASVDTIPTSGGQEDHVSMGVTSALKADAVVKNVSCILAIEMLAAARGIEFHAPLAPGKGVAVAHKALRAVFPANDNDRSWGADIERLAGMLREGWLDATYRTAGVALD